jgi:huntingtin-interacting protein 1-related protein
MALYQATRNVDLTKTETELATNIRKATSIEETAPKRKHVRACIVYTWDHKSSQSFWNGIKVQPIQADEVQTFKALITIHKVLQEGHPIALKEAQQHVQWLESLTRGMAIGGRGGEGMRGYAPLIQEYMFYLTSKLTFHRNHPEFNGTFEYEEYISLKSINDPNEGYETISDLMNLQDQIDSFQKLIFSHFRGGTNNECRISALVPLVQESYGIYKFITSMLRAMHVQLGDDDALSPLRGRYDAQHYRLVRFYYECSNLRYLTSLITVPKLPQDPPNLLADDEAAPALPSRPRNEPVAKPETPPPRPREAADPEPINEFWKNEQARQQEEYEAEQRRLQQQWEEAQRQQQAAALQAQRDFEEQQRLQAEQQRLQYEQLQRDQYAQQTQGRMAELERENLNARAQYERDQLMLEQYDRRMKALEGELAQLNANFQQQSQSKDDQIRALQEQVDTWRTKYEALAKLYGQLRHEHLELLQKFKGVQLKAASAQEAIDKREKLERELKTKNLELADMIRERDRALHEKDRTTGGHREEVEKLKRELRMALDRADNADRAKGSELSAMLSRHNREIADLEEALRNKTRALDDMQMKLGEGSSDLQRQLQEKEEELEIYKSSLDQTLLELNELRSGNGVVDKAMDEQIDVMLLDNIRKIHDIIDSVLQSGVQRVDDALYELDSSMQAGNQNASGPYVLSQIEKAQSSAMEFSTAFNNFIADGPNSTHAEVIRTVHTFSNAIADVLSNTKGLTRFASDEKKGDQLISAARRAASSTVDFFRGIMSYRLDGLEDLQKTDVVINKNNDVQIALNNLSKLADAFAPKTKLTNQSGDLGELVDREMTNAAKAIEDATERLTKLMNKPRDQYSTYELKINDSILEAAIAVTNAIAQLIKAATASQQEIVNQGRGSSMSKTQFYKKNNRWTEGLISAAKAVARSTNMLIETADGVISGRNSPEQLIVASNDVAASTAQLVAASRVKASFMSKTQERLEESSKAVTGACRALVRQVQKIIEERQKGGDEDVDYSQLSGHDFKVRQMEQQVRWPRPPPFPETFRLFFDLMGGLLTKMDYQVEILQLENALSAARHRLGEMRKISYQEED